MNALVGVTVADRPACAVDGCCRTSWARGLCGTHLKRKERLEKELVRNARLSPEAPIRPYGLDPAVHLSRHAISYGNAEEDDEFRRSWEYIRRYAMKCVLKSLRRSRG